MGFTREWNSQKPAYMIYIYLNEIKHSGLNSCVLLGDKGYLSTEWQLDLFTSVSIELQNS